MFWLTIHTALLILAAFILGSVLGCLAWQFFVGRKRVAAATGVAAAAGTARSTGTGTGAGTGYGAGTGSGMGTGAAAGKGTDAATGGAAVAVAESTAGTTAAPDEATAGTMAAPDEAAEAGEAAAVEATAGTRVAEAVAAGASADAESNADRATVGVPDGEIEEEAAAAARLAALPAGASNAEKADAVGTRPEGLAAPRGGKADDLKRIRGIGKVNEQKLGELGIFHFDQIAAWTAREVRWVGTFLAFAGRIEREDWVAQAGKLARGEETDFSRRVDEGDVPTSKA